MIVNQRTGPDSRSPGRPSHAAPRDPRKAIPPSRDRLQSRLLVLLATASTPLLLALHLLSSARLVTLHLPAQFRLALASTPPPPLHLLLATSLSLLLAFTIWKLRAATLPAALLGALFCLSLFLAPLHSPFSAAPALITLVLLTQAATRFGRRAKQAANLAEPRTGRRASQIAANLLIAALCATAPFSAHPSAWFAATLAALAQAAADTVSSESGQALRGPTLLLTTLRPVPPGTDGGISLAGTLLGLTAALLTTLSAFIFHPLSPRLAALVFFSASAGLLFDSLLGATLERRGWIGNDLVNLSSTAFSAALAFSLTLLLPASPHLP